MDHTASARVPGQNDSTDISGYKCSAQSQSGDDPDGSTSYDKKSNPDDDAAVETTSMVLERKIGLLGAVGLVIGIIVGSGIFISPKGVVEAAGSEGLALLIWGIGGVVSMFGALGLAELGCLIPRSGGEYHFLRIAYGNWLGYLYGWVLSVLIKPSSQAVISMTCAEYILVPVFNDGCGTPPQFMIKLLAAIIILLLTAINCYSVDLSNNMQVFFMFGKIMALVIIIAGGIYMMAIGELDNLKTGFEGSNKEAGEIIMGFYSAMFAYDGWASLVYVTEEIINPRRNIPLTFAIAMPLITVMYVLANVSYFTVMSTEELLASPAVAVTWAETVIPKAFWLMPLFVAMSTFGGANASIFTSGRLFFVMAREQEMPQVLSYIHVKRKTPVPAAVFNSLFAIIYILAGSVVSLIDFLSFITWVFIACVQLSVVVLRFTMKDAPRSYKVPIVLPIIVFIFAVTLVVVPVVDAPQIEFLYATLLMLAGLLFYIPIVVFNKRAGCMRYVTKFSQLLMGVCPALGVAEDKGRKSN